MAQIDAVYNYLKENYQENEPIFLADIRVPGIKAASVRQQIKKLTEDGRIKRFDTGVYFVPRKSIFGFGSMLSVTEVIRRKYMLEGESQCGYLSGMLFANRLGLTTQVPMVYEVYTNKATTEYRETSIGNQRVILRRPYVAVNEKNVKTLQFLDLVKEVTDISELEGAELTERLIGYMKANGISFDAMKPFLSYYPDRIYKNMYEVGLMHGVVT